jgi:acyl-CoA synthetase (AMP-forming)/AMP-acid ligase II
MSLIDPSKLLRFDLKAEQERAKTQITESLNAGIREICVRFDSLFTAVWRDPRLTPQQVFDVFGSDAASLFVFAAAIQQAVNTIAPEALPQVPLAEFAINADGTVTVK